MLQRMTFDTIFARCGELLGRWTAAFTDGLRRGRQHDIPAPRRMAATSDPDLHPFEYASDR
jgi:hypothetical protein